MSLYRSSILLFLLGFALAPAVKAAEFEVASIKATGSNDWHYSLSPSANGVFTAKNVPLSYLIFFAFDIQEYQLRGAPDWASERYDVMAKAQGKTSREEMRAMVQKLLMDRCQLRVHMEEKELSQFALRPGKNGLKLQESAEGECPTAPVQTDNATPCGRVSWGARQVQGQRATMRQLIFALSSILARTVVDQTGYNKKFDVNLNWTPDNESFKAGGEDAGGSLSTVLMEQLGLRLETVKGVGQVVVVDHLERPSAN